MLLYMYIKNFKHETNDIYIHVIRLYVMELKLG